MRALVWQAEHTLTLEERLPDPVPGDDEVIVQIVAAGVCATDLHMIRGQLSFAKPPWVLGHEMSGVVRHAGHLVSSWKRGDRVVVDPVVGCGRCDRCLSGKKHLCPEGGEIGTTCGSGGYGEQVAVKSGNLYALPQGLSFEEGAMMEPLNCTLGAVDRVRGMAGSRVIVFGDGPAGLLFTQISRVYGASSVALVGMNDEALALGRRFGADRTWNIRDGSPEESFAAGSFDVAIEAAGSPQAVRDIFQLIAGGGTVVLYGLSGTGNPTVDPDTIVAKDLTLVTCISSPLLWGKCIELVRSGRINVRDIVTHRAPLEEAVVLIPSMTAGHRRIGKLILIHSSADA